MLHKVVGVSGVLWDHPAIYQVKLNFPIERKSSLNLLMNNQFIKSSFFQKVIFFQKAHWLSSQRLYMVFSGQVCREDFFQMGS